MKPNLTLLEQKDRVPFASADSVPKASSTARIILEGDEKTLLAAVFEGIAG